MKKVILLVGGVVAAILFGELLARANEAYLDAVRPGHDAIPEILYYVPNHHTSYTNTPSMPATFQRGPHNALGFRGPEVAREKPKGTYRIVVLGGSTAYGTRNAAEPACWPRVLATELRTENPAVEVVNAGVPAYNSGDAVALLRSRVLALSPDLVIFYGSANDTIPRWFPEFRSDYTHMRTTWSRENRPIPQRRATAIGRLLARLTAPPMPESIPLRLLTSRHYHENVVLEREEFSKTTAAAFARNLRTIVDASRGAGAAVLLATQHFQADALDREMRERADFYRQGFAEFGDATRRLAAEKNVALADLERSVPVVASEFDDFVHHNDVGARRVALAVAETVRRAGLVRGK